MRLLAAVGQGLPGARPRSGPSLSFTLHDTVYWHSALAAACLCAEDQAMEGLGQRLRDRALEFGWSNSEVARRAGWRKRPTRTRWPTVTNRTRDLEAHLRRAERVGVRNTGIPARRRRRGVQPAWACYVRHVRPGTRNLARSRRNERRPSRARVCNLARRTHKLPKGPRRMVSGRNRRRPER